MLTPTQLQQVREKIGAGDLASVMNALGEDYVCFGDGDISLWGWESREHNHICNWQLLKDGKPCNFDEQTEDTKFEIARVLGTI